MPNDLPSVPNDRRAVRRYDADLGAQLLESADRPLPASLEAQVIDISKQGLKIRVWHDARPGCQLSLSVIYNGRESICLGEVIWKREANNGMIYGLRVNRWAYLDPELEYSLTVPGDRVLRSRAA